MRISYKFPYKESLYSDISAVLGDHSYIVFLYTSVHRAVWRASQCWNTNQILTFPITSAWGTICAQYALKNQILWMQKCSLASELHNLFFFWQICGDIHYVLSISENLTESVNFLFHQNSTGSVKLKENSCNIRNKPEYWSTIYCSTSRSNADPSHSIRQNSSRWPISCQYPGGIYVSINGVDILTCTGKMGDFGTCSMQS